MKKRSILLLQGVSSPFFNSLGKAIADNGYTVHKVNFCGGDHHFSSKLKTIDFYEPLSQFKTWISKQYKQLNITDIILFGDTRTMNSIAITVALQNNIAIHVYEEGYLRPHWVTLDSKGVNAYSPLFSHTADWFREQEKLLKHINIEAKATGYSILYRGWYDIRYHLSSFIYTLKYPFYTTHRPISPLKEYIGWIKRYIKLQLRLKQQANNIINELINSHKRYYVLPLQLESDSQIQTHSSYNTIADILQEVIQSFATHAPEKSILVIKNHPFDTGQVNFHEVIQSLRKRYQCIERVLYIESGNLPNLLRKTKGTIVVNSTSGMSALFHESPLFVMGRSIYNIEGLTFKGPLNLFWNRGKKPDPKLFSAVRKTLIAKTQINGDFYSPTGIAMTVNASLKKLDLLTTKKPMPSTANSSPIQNVLTPNSVYLMDE